MRKVSGILAKFRNRRFRLFFALVVAAVLAVSGSLVYEKRVSRVSIDNSLVYAPVSNIAPATAGILKHLFVYEGEYISKGQAIASVGDQTIYAGSDGVIIKADDALGSIISSQNPVAQMIDPDNLRIDGTIDENKGLDKIKIGQVASFTVDALPGLTFWGYVDEISPTAKQTQQAFSISSERPTQQFDVYVKFDAQAYPEIKNGMSSKLIVYTRPPQ